MPHTVFAQTNSISVYITFHKIIVFFKYFLYHVGDKLLILVANLWNALDN